MSVTLSKRSSVAILLFQTVVLLVFAGGYVKLEHDNGQQQDDIQSSLDTGAKLIGCLVTWADDMTTVLEDRDAVNATTRASAVEWLDSLIHQLKHPQSLQTTEELLGNAITYRDSLKQLSRIGKTDVRDYPDIRTCLRKNNLPVPEKLGEVDAAFRLVSYNPDTCFGRRITIRGTPNADIISGTNHRDVILAKGGLDLINAGRGRDRICGGWGNDIINGGGGYDRGNGGPGDDVCLSTAVNKSCT